MHRIKAMEDRLSPQEKRRLERVYAPQVVGTHPSNTWADLCVTPDGEIRCYGHDEYGRFYLSSTDCGFTVCADDALCTANEWTDIELRYDESGCEVFVNGQHHPRLAPQCAAPMGLCYLLVQSSAEYSGRKGAYLKSMSMKAE